CTFEFADVRLCDGRDVADNLRVEVVAAFVALRLENRDARLEVRAGDVRHHTHLETGDETILESGDLLRRTVAGHDDLLVRLVQSVERVEELFLGAVLSGEELDVVDEKDVDSAVGLLELLS